MKKDKSEIVILDQSEGTIQMPEHTPEALEVVEKFVDGVYHRRCEGTIVCKCIDGRDCADCIYGPNSAGGTLSLLIADDLTSQRYVTSEQTLAEGADNLAKDFSERGLPIGIHESDHATGERSGCGANDEIEKIYAMLLKKPEHIRGLAESLIGPISDDTHNMIMSRALERIVFGSGKDVRDAFTDVAGDDACETLEGEHKEIVTTINFVRGTTLDRKVLAADADEKYQGFNVDAWAFEDSARTIATDEADVRAKIVALTYYNLATALVLCGPEMIVGLLKGEPEALLSRAH